MKNIQVCLGLFAITLSLTSNVAFAQIEKRKWKAICANKAGVQLIIIRVNDDTEDTVVGSLTQKYIKISSRNEEEETSNCWWASNSEVECGDHSKSELNRYFARFDLISLTAKVRNAKIMGGIPQVLDCQTKDLLK